MPAIHDVRTVGADALAVGTCALALAACGSSAPSAQSGSSGTSYQRLVSAYVDYTTCARSHGMPNLADPQIDDQGNAHYQALDQESRWSFPRSVLTGCARVWQRVRAIRDQFDNERQLKRPATAADVNQALAFARCIRRHGYPNFPDPGPGGHFVTTPPGFDKFHPSPQARAAMTACRQARR